MVTPAMRVKVAAIMLLLSCGAYAVPPSYTLQTGLGIDDSSDESEPFVYVSGSVLFSKGLSRNSIVDLRGELTLYEYPDNDDISGTQVFLEAVYNYTPRAGYRVPTYSVGLRQIEDDLGENSLDSSETVLILSVSYRLDDLNRLLGGIKYGELDSDSDRTRNSFFATLDHALNPDWLLYTTLEIGQDEIDGDDDAVAGSASPGVARSDFSSHHTPIFSGGVGGEDADISFLTLGASYRLSALNTLDMSYSHRRFEDESGAIYSVDFFHRF